MCNNLLINTSKILSENASVSKVPFIPSILSNTPINITAIITPVEAIAKSPKLSFSEALLSFLSLDIPRERESIKGTVKAPVVAPEASKEMAKNSFEDIRESANITRYIIESNI